MRAEVVAFSAFTEQQVSLEPFAELTYPGGKKPVRTSAPPATSPPVMPSWDAKPIKKLMRGGGEIELFPIGALAAALGRAAVTIRLWEREGVIPVATYRLTSKNGIGGRRYYTRAQIEGIRAIADDEGLLAKGAPLTENFSTRCKQLFVELKKGST